MTFLGYALRATQVQINSIAYALLCQQRSSAQKFMDVVCTELGNQRPVQVRSAGLFKSEIEVLFNIVRVGSWVEQLGVYHWRIDQVRAVQP
jgi:hypothetical protein